MLSTFFYEGIEIFVFRDDLNHATVSGNKLHKLAPNIERAKTSACSTILSFGGPYSNHLHALAWACKEAGLSSIGFVRGELHENLTPTLRDCRQWGMKLVSISRNDYREYQERLSEFKEPCLASDIDVQDCIQGVANTQNTLVIPEGGSNAVAINSLAKAYASIFNEPICEGVTHAVCATGTGATVSGLYRAAPKSVNIIGVQAVAEGGATLERVKAWLGEDATRLVIKEGHLGRFGKMPRSLLKFIEEFETQYNIPLDPVYTGKVMFTLFKLIKVGYFKTEDKVLFIHTGGLQGKRASGRDALKV